MIDKKAEKQKYKQIIQPMGVYQIKNLANGKIYIGTSKNLPGILNRCKFQLNYGSFIIPQLQKDFSELGEKSFAFEVLDILEPKDDPLYNYDDDLETLERLWLDKLQPYNEKGYNKGGQII